MGKKRMSEREDCERERKNERVIIERTERERERKNERDMVSA